jgi:hypothetical protein
MHRPRGGLVPVRAARHQLDGSREFGLRAPAVCPPPEFFRTPKFGLRLDFRAFGERCVLRLEGFCGCIERLAAAWKPDQIDTRIEVALLVGNQDQPRRFGERNRTCPARCELPEPAWRLARQLPQISCILATNHRISTRRYRQSS